MKDNLGGKIDNMKSAIEGSLIEAFKALEPTLEKIVEWITETANWFSNLDEEAQKNIVTIAGVAAAAGPLLMALGQVLIVGGNAVNLFGALKTCGSGNIKMFGLLQNAIKLISGPAGFVALIGMLVALMAKLGDNENKLSDLQEKWGVFGQAIGMICETMTGTVQLSVGNIGILLSTLGKTISAILKGDFKSIDDIWAEGWAKVENNTAKAMSNIRNESANGIALMREMTEVELNNVVGTFDVALQKLPQLTADNAGEMADVFVTRMQGLDNSTLAILRGTSDTMAVLFEGIYENMSKEDAHNKFTANLESMAKSGEFTSDKISQDIADAMNLIDQNVMNGSERVKSSAQSMFDGIASISQFGMDSAVSNIVSSINNMSDETISQLSAMGGHWEALFGGIALTGKDAIVDMESHIKGRLQELSQTSPQFVAEMEAQMSAYFDQANTNGSTSMDELSSNVEADSSQIEQSMSIHTANGANSVDKNTKDAATKGDINTKALKDSVDKNTKDGANALNNNLDKGAKDASKSLNAIKNTTNTDMGSANNAMQQNATNMYKGVSTSFYKMEQKAKQSSTDMMKGVNTSTHKMANESRQDASRMHNGVRDSASAMSQKARSSATEMYKGVTSSTSKMADKAIADWNRIRNAYSKPISGTITKTTVNKTISSGNGATRTIDMDNPGVASNIKAFANIKNPDISEFAISSRYYNSNNTSNIIGQTSRSSGYNHEQSTSSMKSVENTLNTVVSALNNLIDTFSSNIQVDASFNMDGTVLARMTASHFDKVNGNRLNLTERGLLL